MKIEWKCDDEIHLRCISSNFNPRDCGDATRASLKEPQGWERARRDRRRARVPVELENYGRIGAEMTSYKYNGSQRCKLYCGSFSAENARS